MSEKSETTELLARLRAHAGPAVMGCTCSSSRPNCPACDCGHAADEIERLRAENADLKISVIAFGGPAAVERAREYGFPLGHLHPTHYDILAKAGARMDDFTRAEIANGW